MDQLLFGIVIVLVLLGLAGYYAWRQVQTLRRLRATTEMSVDDRRYTTRLAWRRLFCCALMVLLAGLMFGSLFLNERASQLAREVDLAEERGEDANLNDEQKEFARYYSYYWIFSLLVLLVIVTLAAIDMLATRRFGLRQYRQIQADRRAMIEEQVARRRHQRNGHG